MSDDKQLVPANVIDQSMPQFRLIADAHKLVRWEEESQFALQALQKSEQLRRCERETVRDAIINIAACGLTLNPAHGYAFLVPEYNTQSKKLECQLRISFKGLVKAATDSGAVLWVVADVVKKTDRFTFHGKWAKPDHQFEPFGDRGESIGVYCTAKLADGDYLTELVQWDDVVKARKAAKFDGVWATWTDEMAKKMAIKRASKQWPKTQQGERFDRVAHVINQYEGSDDPMEKLTRYADAIRTALTANDDAKVYDLWQELSDSEKRGIYTAHTKGGWFKAAERKALDETLWRENVKRNPGVVEKMNSDFGRVEDLKTAVLEAVATGDPEAVAQVMGPLTDADRLALSSRLTGEQEKRIRELENEAAEIAIADAGVSRI